MDCRDAKRVSPPSRDSKESCESIGEDVESMPGGCLLPETHAYLSPGARCGVSVHRVGVVGASEDA